MDTANPIPFPTLAHHIDEPEKTDDLASSVHSRVHSSPTSPNPWSLTYPKSKKKLSVTSGSPRRAHVSIPLTPPLTPSSSFNSNSGTDDDNGYAYSTPPESPLRYAAKRAGGFGAAAGNSNPYASPTSDAGAGARIMRRMHSTSSLASSSPGSVDSITPRMEKTLKLGDPAESQPAHILSPRAVEVLTTFEGVPEATRYILIRNIPAHIQPENVISPSKPSTTTLTGIKGAHARFHRSHGVLLVAFFDLRDARRACDVLKGRTIREVFDDAGEVTGESQMEKGEQKVDVVFVGVEHIVELVGSTRFVDSMLPETFDVTVEGRFDEPDAIRTILASYGALVEFREVPSGLQLPGDAGDRAVHKYRATYSDIRHARTAYSSLDNRSLFGRVTTRTSFPGEVGHRALDGVEAGSAAAEGGEESSAPFGGVRRGLGLQRLEIDLTSPEKRGGALPEDDRGLGWASAGPTTQSQESQAPVHAQARDPFNTNVHGGRYERHGHGHIGAHHQGPAPIPIPHTPSPTHPLNAPPQPLWPTPTGLAHSGPEPQAYPYDHPAFAPPYTPAPYVNIMPTHQHPVFHPHAPQVEQWGTVPSSYVQHSSPGLGGVDYYLGGHHAPPPGIGMPARHHAHAHSQSPAQRTFNGRRRDGRDSAQTSPTSPLSASASASSPFRRSSHANYVDDTSPFTPTFPTLSPPTPADLGLGPSHSHSHPHAHTNGGSRMDTRTATANPTFPSLSPPTPADMLSADSYASALDPLSSCANTNTNTNTNTKNTLSLPAIGSGLDTRTTVMIKNIPNKMTDRDLVGWMRRRVCGDVDGAGGGGGGERWGAGAGAGAGEGGGMEERGTRGIGIDFLYLRMDFGNGCNVGYAFVNFITVQDLLHFASTQLNVKWNMYSSEKTLQLSYANYQGKEALVEKFKNSSIMDEREAWRPKIFYSSGPNVGLPEPFPPPTHLRRKERSAHNRGALFVPGPGSAHAHGRGGGGGAGRRLEAGR